MSGPRAHADLSVAITDVITEGTGNGCHLHITLHDEGDEGAGANIFADASTADPLGLSDLAKTFLGGILEHGPALTALGCPTVNSYKRLGVSARTPESGATWAPTVLSHGGNDRTHMIRVPGAPRYELRLGDMAGELMIYTPVHPHERAPDSAGTPPPACVRYEPAEYQMVQRGVGGAA